MFQSSWLTTKSIKTEMEKLETKSNTVRERLVNSVVHWRKLLGYNLLDPRLMLLSML